MKQVAHGHTTGEWWNQNLNPGSTSPGSTVLCNLTHHSFGATKEKPGLVFQGCVEIRSFWNKIIFSKISIQKILFNKIIFLLIAVNDYWALAL